MISYKNFKDRVGSRFWNHIHSNTLLPYRGSNPDRSAFLKKLSVGVEGMKYVPMPPRGFVVSHKQNLVVRFIPSLTKEDYCVYFFCIKSLEDEIAKNRIAGTYGGWKLGGKIRAMENFDLPALASMPDGSFDKFAWKQAWTDYQKKAYKFYTHTNFEYFIIFDIANFYDSIRLAKLETLIREVVSKNKTSVVNLLFYFLTNLGKKDLDYGQQTIGIPQDEVGDCSRILANFYLQEYDKKVYDLANKHSSGYLRYADDQIIASADTKTAKALMFEASKELAKLGLNLNAAKAKLMNRKEFHDYWSFDIFKLLEDTENAMNIEMAFDIYKKKVSSGVHFKPETILRRFLSCNLNKLPTLKHEILDLVLQKDFLINANDYYLQRIYFFLPKSRKNNFLSQLNKFSSDVLFNQYHLRVLKFAKKHNFDLIKFSQVRKSLLELIK